MQPGERYQPSEIERRAVDRQRRLEATGVFYQVAVSVIPPNRYLERRSGDTRYADAYGAGLKLIFDNPVNVTFELSAGINYQGDSRIVFRQELTL